MRLPSDPELVAERGHQQRPGAEGRQSKDDRDDRSAIPADERQDDSGQPCNERHESKSRLGLPLPCIERAPPLIRTHLGRIPIARVVALQPEVKQRDEPGEASARGEQEPLESSQHSGAALITERAAEGIDLTRPSPDLAERTERMVRDWQAGLMDLLRRESGAKQTSAKVLSYGVNGVALVLMVGVFAQTGGLTGAEVAIAGGSSAVGQKLVEALLGDQAVRRLTAVARSDLERRVDALIDAEAARFDAALARHRPSGHASQLRQLSGRLRKGAAT